MRRMSFITVVGSYGAKNMRFQGFLFGKAIFLCGFQAVSLQIPFLKCHIYF